MSLPTPNKISQQHSDRVSAMIAEKILSNGGAIPFYEYMRLALYEPGLGYYSAGAQKLGAAGDFVTAPEISPLFSWCLARQCAQVLSQLQRPMILELGAGSGVMALEILRELERLNALPEKYYILEVSADLRERQQTLIAKEAADLFPLVEWLDALPESPIEAVVLANEVADAMPVHRFKIDKGVKEFYVAMEGDKFCWQLAEPSNQQLVAAIESLEVSLADGYCSEINLALPSWIAALEQSITRGVMFFIDYGYAQEDFYHPQRHMGTLMCHYQHRAHDDPLILAGIQDITASVDFTALALAGVEAKMSVAGYVHQAGFLLNLGLTDYMASCSNDLEHYKLAQQVKRLTLPSEMGERFKVLALTKDFDQPLQGFAQFDQLEKL